MEELREELNDLKAMVSQQHKDLQRRDVVVSQLQNKLLSVQQQLRERDEAPKRDSSGNLRPLDAQSRAIGDRRGVGMYDARYHSTSWCALQPLAFAAGMRQLEKPDTNLHEPVYLQRMPIMG